MASIDKLYDKNNNVVVRLDSYTNEDLKYILKILEIKDAKEQIEMYLEEYNLLI